MQPCNLIIGLRFILLSCILIQSVAWSAEPDQAVARGPLSISYDMPRDAELSMGVFDKDGHLLRHIAKADFRQAGKNTEYWDGRDQYGKPIPAGEYQVKALYHDPISTEHALTLANPGTPPWPTSDGKGDWLSDEANPQAAVTDGKWVYLAAPGSELGWSIIAVDENGQRQWGINAPVFPRCVSLAVQGDNLYVLYSGPESEKKEIKGRALLMCFDKRTGNAINFTKTNPRFKIANFPYDTEQSFGLWDLRANKSFEPAVYGGQPRYFNLDICEPTSALGIAATSDTIYVSMYFDDKVLAFDPVTGAAKSDHDLAIPKPVGLHAISDDTLLAVSDAKIVRINLHTKTITPLATSGLAAPHTVTADKKGEIYVSDWKDSFQVKVFSPDGKFLRAIGKPGGRPWIGKWDQDGMLAPRGIAVTDDEMLWVAEDDQCPSRVSVWDAAGGNFLRDYIGPTGYGGGSVFWMEPSDPTIAHTLGTRFKLDWEKKSYSPEAIEIRRMSRDQPFAVNGHAIFGSNTSRVFKHGGKDYVGISFGSMLYVVLMRNGDIYTPVAAVGGLNRGATDDGTGFQDSNDGERGRHMIKNYWPEFFKGHVGDNFAWTDSNGDGLVQAEEMTWAATLSRGDPYLQGRQVQFFCMWGVGMGPDWSLYFPGFCRDKTAMMRLSPTGWTQAGAPKFDINKAVTVETETFGFGGLYVNNEGKVFTSGRDLAYAQITNKFTDPRPDALSCFDRNGKKLWGIACVTDQTAKDVMASNTIGEFKLPGIGNVVCTWQWWGNYRPYFVSSDGLYVGTTLDEGKNGPAGLWGESFNYFYQSPDGTPYIINGGNDGHHILRLRGLETGGRFESALKLGDADVKLAASAPPIDSTASDPRQKPVLSVRWLDKAPAIDGNLSEWNMNYAAAIEGGEGRSASVALGRNADKLFLAYHIKDDTPLLNKGSDWQTLFISGDCVDLMLSTDPKADPNRSAAVSGDLRLLLGSFQNDPITVLYRPVAAGSDLKPVQLMLARLDRIERITNAKVAFRRATGFYEIEASVPLKELGISPAETKMLRGDAGAIYSDASGNDRIKRACHYNKKTQMVSDLTTEATLQPAEWGAVRFPLAGANLLKNGGFEGAAAKLPTDGWAMNGGKNDKAVEFTASFVHSGKHSLHFQASGSAIQQVSIVGGKKYSLRFFYHAKGFKPKSGSFGTNIRWLGKVLESPDITSGIAIWTGKVGDAGNLPVSDVKKDSNGWAECFDERIPDYYAPRAYLAPAGATAAIVSFNLNAAANGGLSVYVDDVELICED